MKRSAPPQPPHSGPLSPRERASLQRRPPAGSTANSPALRRGITLYEVVLSTAIFLVSLAALSELFATGSRAAIQSRLQSEATLRCQGKLSEVLGGIVPITAVSGGSFEDGGTDWTWSLNVADGPHANLLALEVTVSHLDQTGNPDATSSLRRLTRNPQSFLDAASLEAEFEQAQSTQSGGTTP